MECCNTTMERDILFRTSNLKFNAMKSRNFFTLSLTMVAVAAISFSSCKKEDVLTGSVNASGKVLKSAQVESTPGSSANGHGFFYEKGDKRQFSFNATKGADGSVSGSGVLTFNGPDNPVIKFDITCISVVGDMASLTGVVTSSNVWPVGNPVYFQVIDGGEGSTAQDGISFLYSYADPDAPDCSAYPELPVYAVNGGNIQVK